MSIKRLPVLALVVAATWSGGNSSRGQQFPTAPLATGQPVAGMEQFQTNPDQPAAGAIAPVSYAQPGYAQPGYGQPNAQPAYGQPEYGQPAHLQAAYMQPFYGQPAAGQAGIVPGSMVESEASLQPYFHQTPPGSYFNQVNDSAYYDPNQLDAYGNPAGELGGEFGPPCYSEAHCFFYTRAEVFMMDRDIKNDAPFTSMRVGGPIVLRSGDLDFEYEPGVRAVAGIPLSDCLALEASYFGLQNWDDIAAATDPAGNLFSVFSNFGTGTGFIINGRQIFDFTEGSNMQSIRYESELHNAELNLMHRFPLRSCKQEVWLFAGARYIKVKEYFEFMTEAQTNDPILRIRSSLSTVDTDNDLVGFQLGGVLNHFFTKRFRVSMEAKSGVHANFTEQRSLIATNLFVVGGEELQNEAVALSVDAGVSCTYDITCWLSVTGGYRMMYLDGLALGPNNFNPVLPGTGLRTPMLNDDGSVIYQGATAGFEMRW